MQTILFSIINSWISNISTNIIKLYWLYSWAKSWQNLKKDRLSYACNRSVWPRTWSLSIYQDPLSQNHLHGRGSMIPDYPNSIPKQFADRLMLSAEIGQVLRSIRVYAPRYKCDVQISLRTCPGGFERRYRMSLQGIWTQAPHILQTTIFEEDMQLSGIYYHRTHFNN